MLFAISIAAACTIEEQIVPDEKPVEGEIVTIEAWREGDPETRTVRKDNGAVNWIPGDAISLFYGRGSGGGSKFTSSATDTCSVTNFTGTITANTGGSDTYYCGVYPYSEDVACDGNMVTLSVPSHQTAVPGTFATSLFPSIGRSQGLVMCFYNVCGGWRFNLQKEGVKKVTLKSNGGEKIVGKVKVEVDASGIPTVKEIIDGSDEVVLEAPEGEFFEVGKNYYIVLLPTVFKNGFTMTIETLTEQGVYNRSKETEISRSMFSGFSGGTYRPLDIYLTEPYAPKAGNALIGDPSFKSYLVSNFDSDGDGEISYGEALKVTNISTIDIDGKIQSLAGIEFFPNLDTLVVVYNTSYWLSRSTSSISSDSYDEGYFDYLKSLGVNNFMTRVRAQGFYLPSDRPLDDYIDDRRDDIGGINTNIDLRNNQGLKYLALGSHWGMKNLDLSKNKELKVLNLASCDLPGGINLTSCEKLEYINLFSCFLTGNLDISKCKELKEIIAYDNAFSEVVIGNLEHLENLHISSPVLKNLDVTGCPNLKNLFCPYCQNLESLDLSNCPKLERVFCPQCEEVHFDIVQRMPDDVSNKNSIIRCMRQGIVPRGNQMQLDISHNHKLKQIDWSGNIIEGFLDLKQCSELEYLNVAATGVDGIAFGNPSALKGLDVSGCDNLTSLDLSEFVNLERVLTTGCVNLGPVDYSACTKLYFLYMPPSGSVFPSRLDDLQVFGFCEENPEECFPFLRGVTSITILCALNYASFDFTKTPDLLYLYIGTANCPSIDLSPCTKLNNLFVAACNGMETIDISKNPLHYFYNYSPSLKAVYVNEGQKTQWSEYYFRCEYYDTEGIEHWYPAPKILIAPSGGGSEGTGDNYVDP